MRDERSASDAPPRIPGAWIPAGVQQVLASGTAEGMPSPQTAKACAPPAPSYVFILAVPSPGTKPTVWHAVGAQYLFADRSDEKNEFEMGVPLHSSVTAICHLVVRAGNFRTTSLGEAVRELNRDEGLWVPGRRRGSPHLHPPVCRKSPEHSGSCTLLRSRVGNTLKPQQSK